MASRSPAAKSALGRRNRARSTARADTSTPVSRWHWRAKYSLCTPSPLPSSRMERRSGPNAAVTASLVAAKRACSCALSSFHGSGTR